MITTYVGVQNGVLEPNRCWSRKDKIHAQVLTNNFKHCWKDATLNAMDVSSAAALSKIQKINYVSTWKEGAYLGIILAGGQICRNETPHSTE